MKFRDIVIFYCFQKKVMSLPVAVIGGSKKVWSRDESLTYGFVKRNAMIDIPDHLDILH